MIIYPTYVYVLIDGYQYRTTEGVVRMDPDTFTEYPKWEAEIHLHLDHSTLPFPETGTARLHVRSIGGDRHLEGHYHVTNSTIYSADSRKTTLYFPRLYCREKPVTPIQPIPKEPTWADLILGEDPFSAF